MSVEQTNRINQLDQQAGEIEAQIRLLEQQLTAANGQQRLDLETQLRALVATHSINVEEANRLRVQLGLPVVVPNLPLPAIMTDQPTGPRNDEWATTPGE